MNLIRKRQEIKLDAMIDGHVGFLSVTRNGRPRTHSEYADVVRKLTGHSDARTTLNIYTDKVMDKVYESMELRKSVAINLRLCYHTQRQFYKSMTKNGTPIYTICTQNANGVGNVFE